LRLSKQKILYTNGLDDEQIIQLILLSQPAQQEQFSVELLASGIICLDSAITQKTIRNFYALLQQLLTQISDLQ
jgi:hypothetical protein